MFKDDKFVALDFMSYDGKWNVVELFCKSLQSNFIEKPDEK